MERRRDKTPVDSGQLRHRITIERFTEATTGDYGKSKGAWAPWQTVRARVEQLAGFEASVAHSVNAEATVKVTIRHLPGLTTKDRINFGGRRLSIQVINDVEFRGVKNELLCKWTH